VDQERYTHVTRPVKIIYGWGGWDVQSIIGVGFYLSLCYLKFWGATATLPPGNDVKYSLNA